MSPLQITSSDESFPPRLIARLGDDAPQALHVAGHPDALAGHLTAFFCSAQTPGSAILRAHDAARALRDEGRTVISGFHSPLERECLRILLRGKQPIIYCVARSLEKLRVPGECRAAFDAGRVLFVSPFEAGPHRATRSLAFRRNVFAAAMADAAFVAHVTPGGKTERIVEMLRAWGVTLLE